jgi:hypothetical protein
VQVVSLSAIASSCSLGGADWGCVGEGLERLVDQVSKRGSTLATAKVLIDGERALSISDTPLPLGEGNRTGCRFNLGILSASHPRAKSSASCFLDNKFGVAMYGRTTADSHSRDLSTSGVGCSFPMGEEASADGQRQLGND